MEAIKVVSNDGGVNFFGGFDHLIIKDAKWARDSEGRIGFRYADAPEDCKVGFVDKIILRRGDALSLKEGDHCRVFMLNSPTGFSTVLTDAKVFVLGSGGKTIDTFH